MRMKNATVEIKRRWNGKAMQTEELLPDGSAAALIGYTLDLLPEEVGLASIMAGALVRGLTKCGTVAGRWFDEVEVPWEARLWPAQTRNIIRRIVGRVRYSWAVPVVTTRSAEIVLMLLEQGWRDRDQALLVLGEEEGADWMVAVRALSVNRDWRSFTFPDSVLALVAPGVYGDWILVAAASEERLGVVLDCLIRSFRAAGFSCPGR